MNKKMNKKNQKVQKLRVAQIKNALKDVSYTDTHNLYRACGILKYLL